MANLNIDEHVSELRKVAKEHGLEIRFRNTKTAQGDFCIYIYDRKNFRNSYAVGYDGSWNSKAVNFEKCLAAAYKWIERRDKRFIFRDDRWQYGHYHFIIWKDKNGKDCEHYLTIGDADKAAADYVKQGYAVVCYDQEPSGKNRLAKVYGDYSKHCNDYVKNSIKRANI